MGDYKGKCKFCGKIFSSNYPKQTRRYVEMHQISCKDNDEKVEVWREGEEEPKKVSKKITKKETSKPKKKIIKMAKEIEKDYNLATDKNNPDYDTNIFLEEF